MTNATQVKIKLKNDYATLLQGWGEWAIKEVQFISAKKAWISYERRVINATAYKKHVSLNLIDCMKGITLDEKVQSKVDSLTIKLEEENMRIRDFKSRQKSIQI